MIDKAKKYLESEAKAISSIPLDDNLELAVNLIASCTGKLLTTGIGKAGYIAKKAASTFSTTGTPSVFIHPAESAHGEAGLLAKGDLLLAYSNSGKTREVIETALFAKALGVESILAITADTQTPLSAEADIVLPIGKTNEACPFGLTPTSSAAAMLALSDVLALLAMEKRGFTKDQWAERHHGGYLGKKSREESS